MTVRPITRYYRDGDCGLGLKCLGCDNAVPPRKPGTPGSQNHWCSETCRKREWRRAKSAPCTACGLRTSTGLCRWCEAERTSPAEARYTATGVHLPLRNRKGEVVAWAVVDANDAAGVLRYRWSLTPRGYAHRRARRHEDPKARLVFLHRQLLGLDHGDDRQGDHWNGDTLNNRRENLRSVTPAQNAQNKVRVDGSSRFRGVSYYKRDGVWVASVGHERRSYYAGRYATEEAAGEAAAALRAQLHTHANEERHRVAA